MRTARTVILLLVAAAVAAGASAADSQGGVRLFAKVKSVSAGSFTVQEKRGSFVVSLPEPPPPPAAPASEEDEAAGAEPPAKPALPITEFAARPIGLLPPGTWLAVLGRKTEGIQDETPHIYMIEAIVAGADYAPPAVTPAQSAKGLTWTTGTSSMTGARPCLDKYEIKVPKERLVAVAAPAAREAVAAKRLVFVEGERTSEPRANTTEVHPARIALLAPQIPLAEYDAILGAPEAAAPITARSR